MVEAWPVFGLSPSMARLLFLVVLGAYSAVLMNKMIANFHDGLRPVLPEFIEGRMKRGELAGIAVAISLGFVLGWVPLTLTSGLVLVGLILLPTDVIGSVLPNWWLSAIGGGAWGAVVATGLQGIQEGAKLLPVDVLGPLAALATPLVFAFVAFPVVAVGYQFGWKKGLIALTVAVLARQLLVAFGTISVGGTQISLSPDGAAMLFGMLMLIVFAIQQDRQIKQSNPAQEDSEGFFGQRSSRIYRNILWLALQGALLAFGTRAAIIAWQPPDLAAAAAGKLAEGGILAIALALGFLPLIATTALATGVYQAVGLCFAFVAAYFSPNPYVAFVAGGAVVAVEVLLLRQIGRFLDRYGTLRESADSLRNAMDKVVTYALLAGSMVAGDQMLPGGSGYFMVAGLFVLNEFAGAKIMPMAAAPAAAIITGIVANLLTVFHIMPK